MSKVVKITVSAITLLLALFIISIILLTTLVNPNKFKSQISAAIEKSTGRQFAISGDIKWSFFPWIGLRMQQMALGNAPGYGAQPFAQVGEADVNIRLLPLFYGKVEIGTVTLKNLALHLSQKAPGQNNWNDITSNNKSGNNSAANKANTNSSGSNSHLPNLSISNLDISNATVTWNNQQTGQKATINQFYLQSKDVNFNEAFPVKLKFHVISNKPAVEAQVAFNSDVMINSDKQQYTLRKMELTGNLIGKKYPKGRVPFDVKADVSTNLNKQTLNADHVILGLDNLKAQGELSGDKILQAPVFNGKLVIPAFNLRTLLNDLGQKIQTEDPAVLEKAALKAQAQFSPKFIKLDDLTANLDDTTLNGKFSFANFNNKNFDFDLKLDQINLSRYLTTTNTNQEKHSKFSFGSKNNVSANSSSNGTLPVNLLRQLNGQGSFKIGKFTVANITANNINTQVTAKNGIIKISPVNADLYQGKSQGAIVINAQGNTPTITANENLSNVQIGNLMNDVSKTSKVQISGTSNLNMNLQTQGQTSAAMLRALNGTINFAINNGSIKNIDIGQQIYAAIEHFFKRSATGWMSSDQTNFSSLTGTIHIVNGIATNNDLLLQSPSLKVTGKGTANLVNQKINYGMNAIALGSPFGRDILNLQQQIGGSIPITVSGNLMSPSVGPDYTTITTALLKGQFRKQIENRLSPNINKALNNLKGNLQNILGG